MSFERPADQRFWAFLAHICAVLAFPDLFKFLAAYYAWGSLPPTMAQYSLALVPLAPLISYLIYRAQRRRPEREWTAFHALQAAFLQTIVFVVRFTIPPGWYIGSFPIGVAAYAFGIALIAYGLLGAVAAYMGLDFMYAGLGRLAEGIVQRSHRQS